MPLEIQHGEGWERGRLRHCVCADPAEWEDGKGSRDRGKFGEDEGKYWMIIDRGSLEPLLF
jgi:hypothetical protein